MRICLREKAAFMIVAMILAVTLILPVSTICASELAADTGTYHNGMFIGEGTGTQNVTILSPVYPEGHSSYDLSVFRQEIEVKLTDASGNPLAGKTVEWKGNSGNYYNLTVDPAFSVTDTEGIAKSTISVALPQTTEYKKIIVDSYITASYSGDNDYNSSTCQVKAYREFTLYYLAGDANGDGSTNSLDFAVLKIYLLGGNIAIDTLAADMNNDGILDTIDLMLLKKLLLGR